MHAADCALVNASAQYDMMQSVIEILDHHKDMASLSHVTGDKRMIAFDNEAGTGIGSTCTLVVQQYQALMADKLVTVAPILLGTPTLTIIVMALKPQC